MHFFQQKLRTATDRMVRKFIRTRVKKTFHEKCLHIFLLPGKISYFVCWRKSVLGLSLIFWSRKLVNCSKIDQKFSNKVDDVYLLRKNEFYANMHSNIPRMKAEERKNLTKR